ncbi:MAG: beta-galactosidase [Lachnospiraceae bacterium]|jgi:beta-galactosidase|nr:beta-galactosidase [Lachnospiraceae bacterium]
MWKKVWNHSKIAYGGDYNPEQWPEETWEEDMRLLKLAHIDTLTLNVFSWAALQPSEDTYCFGKLDKIMELAKRHGMKVCLATSTGAHPAWMARKYPEILRTDFYGRRHKFGARHNSCPNSPVYRKFSVQLASKLAERYQAYDNIVAWHISNEYGGECYCENCEKAFREWLKKRYGALEEVNRAWNTSFWGHTFYDWEEIVLPDQRSEHIDEEHTVAQAISLDYRRFNSDSILECFRLEYDAVKEYTPGIPVTTNLMGAYKPLDYMKWGKYLDFISWDNYPSNEDSVSQIAMNHDLMRGVGGNKPFVLMEQTPSQQNWQPFNALKRPGVMRLWSYQAVAHGSDAVMFFQMKRSIGSCEKYHGAVISHAGHEHTRVFRECAALGAELEKLGGEILGSTVQAEAAILFDWENWWAADYSAGPSVDLKYHDEVLNYYTALHRQNIPVDLVCEEDDFSKYKLLAAPVMYMTKPGADERIREFVEKGGTFVTTFFSGYVDENDLVILGGYPGRLRDVLGVWVEEIDALPPHKKNRFSYQGQAYEAKLLCDIMHLEGAQALAGYEEDFYAGSPVVSRNSYGQGQAYYVGTRSGEDFYQKLMADICKEQQIQPAAKAPEGVEVTRRVRGQEEYLFFLNHGEGNACFEIPRDGLELLTGKACRKGEVMELEAKGVAVLKNC